MTKYTEGFSYTEGLAEHLEIHVWKNGKDFCYLELKGNDLLINCGSNCPALATTEKRVAVTRLGKMVPIISWR